MKRSAIHWAFDNKDVPAVQRFIGLVEFLFKFLQKLSEMREPLRRLTRRNASGSELMSETKPSKTMVSQWYLEEGRFRWQRGSIPRSRSNFLSQFLAWCITTNMCSVRKSVCGLIQKPWSPLYNATGISTQETRAPCRDFSSMTTRYATSL